MFKSLLFCLPVVPLFLGCGMTTVDDTDPVKEAQTPTTPEEPLTGESGDSVEQPPAEESDDAQVLETRLKKIGLAFHAFHDEFGHFPPAASRDASGTPLLSWRVHLLPFLGHEDLYREFHLNEPWDSPHNSTLVEKMPDDYAASDLGDGKTSFMVFLGDEAVFGGKKAESWSRPLRPYVSDRQLEPPKMAADEAESFRNPRQGRGGPWIAEMRDGTSNTILVVQAGDDKQTPWTKPDDLPFQPENPMAPLGTIPEDGFLALFGDAQVKRIPRDIAPEKLAACITRAGGDYDQP